MYSELQKVAEEIQELDYKFLSANEVKVERAIISAKEWEALRLALTRSRAILARSIDETLSIPNPLRIPRKHLTEAFLYLKDHNIYACDRGNTFRYTRAEDGSAVLAHFRKNRLNLPHNSATMEGLPSQRAVRTITHSGRTVDFKLLNQSF